MTRAGPVRIGLVGCGSFARFALGAVAESPLVSLVAVSDPREECRLEAVRVWHQAGRVSPEGTAPGHGIALPPEPAARVQQAALSPERGAGTVAIRAVP
ncbi:MAG: hypothetical protein QME93_10395, partial [Bacillota bacterium]|nr:hypothetical protein [Bacillota bacterium]